MTLSYLLFFGFLVAGCLGDNTRDANHYMDTILKEYLPNNVRNDRLDPAILPDFKVKVEGSIWKGQADFKAKFKSGQLFGLSHVPSRHGDCSGPTWRGANITIGCFVALDYLRAHYSITSKGDTLVSKEKKYFGDYTVEKSTFFVEITQRQGSSPSVQTFNVNRLNLDWKLSTTLSLNNKRMRKYEEQSKSKVQQDITSVLNDGFRNALDISARNRSLPRP